MMGKNDPCSRAISWHFTKCAYSSMMYNTGDLGAWREDGEIEMLGRVDDQIKIKVGAAECR